MRRAQRRTWMLETGWISIQPRAVSSTYDPTTRTLVPALGIRTAEWKLWQAAFASAWVTGSWHIGSRMSVFPTELLFTLLSSLENSGLTASWMCRSPSGSPLMCRIVPVTAMQLATMRNRVLRYTCSHNPALHPDAAEVL